MDMKEIRNNRLKSRERKEERGKRGERGERGEGRGERREGELEKTFLALHFLRPISNGTTRI